MTRKKVANVLTEKLQAEIERLQLELVRNAQEKSSLKFALDTVVLKAAIAQEYIQIDWEEGAQSERTRVAMDLLDTINE